MKPTRLLPIFVLFLSLIAFLSGCATTDPARFYLLNSIDSPGLSSGNTRSEDDLKVGIGPITLPRHLDRPQIITRNPGNELVFEEFERWAEPLEKNLYTVITEDVTKLLGSDNVHQYPLNWPGPGNPDFQVTIDIIRFDTTDSGVANLIVRWAIRTGARGSGKILYKKRSEFSESAKTNDFKDVVAALNRTIELFCREIAGAIEGAPLAPTDE